MKYPVNNRIFAVRTNVGTVLRDYERGLSLIELMISISIGLVLMAGITALIVQQSGTRTELEKSSQQIENGRYAMQLLQEDIQLAGYYGEYSKVLLEPGLDAWNTGTPSLPDPCTTTIFNADPTVLTQLGPAMPLHLQGYNNVGSSIPMPLSSCLNAGNHLDGTDILIVRHTDTTTIPVGSAAATQAYLQTGIHPASNKLSYVLGSGTDTSVFTLKTNSGAIAPLRPYLVRIYFISPCSNPASAVCASSDDNIPTLKRMTLGAGPSFTTESLVEGIENLQLDYGIDYPVAPASIGDGATDCYVTDPGTPTISEINACPSSAATYFASATSATNWSNVMTVKINILARNTEATAGYTDRKKYNLGGSSTVGPFNDQFKRHVFSGLVRAINPSGRRE